MGTLILTIAIAIIILTIPLWMDTFTDLLYKFSLVSRLNPVQCVLRIILILILAFIFTLMFLLT